MNLRKRLLHKTTARIDRRIKKAVLKEILASREFTSSRINRKLLEYLVDASIKNRTPTEYDIAINVFDRDAHFNPNEDAIVRVSIHNLRKKLETYYQHEGKHAKTRIEIPKGRYEVVFTHPQTSTKRFFLSTRFALVALVAVLAGLFLWSQIRLHRLEQTAFNTSKVWKHPVWRDILQSRFPKMIVLGDDFFYLQSDDTAEVIVRRHSINSPEDLNRFVRQSPGLEIRGKTPYAFIPMACVKPLVSILPIFRPGQNVTLQYSSALQSKDLLANDIVFFGTFRNLYLLGQLLKNRLIDYHIGWGQNWLRLNVGDTVATYELNGNPGREHCDYCLVTKLRGPKGNTILTFVSFFETGMIGAIQYMTSPEHLAELDRIFSERFGRFPPYFEVLFKTSGFSRTAFTTRVVYFDRIAPAGIVW
ncbi:MAG: hypothetical protein GXO73_07140 [Calditrichaeota bacterium]|nr:hypothetical protein [Calditrichota bacterium]